MAGVAEENRRRIGKALCLLGAGLILAGVALVLQHRGTIASSQKPAPGGPANSNILFAQAIRQVLFWLLVLMGIFGVSTFAFLRWSRRFRNWMLCQPHPPTSADDVWAMHRMPGEPPADAGPRREPRDPGSGGSPRT